jgi:nucleotide-binding universal stress UspA family protein
MTVTHGDSSESAKPVPSGAGRIVVGVDGSAASAAALRWAIRQSKLTGTGLDAVISWTIPAAAAETGALPDNYNPARDAEQTLVEAVGPERSADLDLRTIEIEGAPGPGLVDYSEHAELLVIGSRGHGFVAGLLLGSVSEYCVSHAHCPVLVLRTPPAS